MPAVAGIMAHAQRYWDAADSRIWITAGAAGSIAHRSRPSESRHSAHTSAAGPSRQAIPASVFVCYTQPRGEVSENARNLMALL